MNFKPLSENDIAFIVVNQSKYLSRRGHRGKSTQRAQREKHAESAEGKARRKRRV